MSSRMKNFGWAVASVFIIIYTLIPIAWITSPLPWVDSIMRATTTLSVRN